jgi:hypothetical protein
LASLREVFMAEFESPTYVLHLRDKSTCSRIQSARPGKEVPVLVRPELNKTAKPIKAKGILSDDGKTFSVVVTRADGKQQTHAWNYKELLEQINNQPRSMEEPMKTASMCAALIMLTAILAVGCGQKSEEPKATPKTPAPTAAPATPSAPAPSATPAAPTAATPAPTAAPPTPAGK